MNICNECGAAWTVLHKCPMRAPKPDAATVEPCAWCGRGPEVPTCAGLPLPNCPDPKCFEHYRTDTVEEWNDRQRRIRAELERRERAAWEGAFARVKVLKSLLVSDDEIRRMWDDYIAGRKP